MEVSVGNGAIHSLASYEGSIIVVRAPGSPPRRAFSFRLKGGSNSRPTDNFRHLVAVLTPCRTITSADFHCYLKCILVFLMGLTRVPWYCALGVVSSVNRMQQHVQNIVGLRVRLTSSWLEHVKTDKLYSDEYLVLRQCIGDRLHYCAPFRSIKRRPSRQLLKIF